MSGFFDCSERPSNLICKERTDLISFSETEDELPNNSNEFLPDPMVCLQEEFRRVEEERERLERDRGLIHKEIMRAIAVLGSGPSSSTASVPADGDVFESLRTLHRAILDQQERFSAALDKASSRPAPPAAAAMAAGPHRSALDALSQHELPADDTAGRSDRGGIEPASAQLEAALALVAEVTAERDGLAAQLDALSADGRTSSASDSFSRYLPKLSVVPARSSGAVTRQSGVSSDGGEEGRRLSVRGSFEYSLDTPAPPPVGADRAAQARLLAALRARLGDARDSLAALRAEAAAACDGQAAALRAAGSQLVAVAAAAGAAHAGFAREAAERKKLHNQVPARTSSAPPRRRCHFPPLLGPPLHPHCPPVVFYLLLVPCAEVYRLNLEQLFCIRFQHS